MLTFGEGPCPGAAVGDPLLGPLEDHGGPVPTLAPGAGSAAIDLVPAGACGAGADDARGVARPQGLACDAGAYEAAPPAAATGAATALTATSATVAGTVNPVGRAIGAVEYGTTTAYGARAGGGELTGLAPRPLAVPLTGLTPATTYHYRVVAESPYGTATGEDGTFTTPAVPPPGIGDTTAPALTAAAIRPKRFRARKGATLAFTLDEAATVRASARRRAAGRRVAGRCRKPTRGNRDERRCRRLVGAGARTLAATAGANATAIKRRLGAKRLRPGRYVLALVATDAAGNRAAPVTLRFRVLKPER